MNGLRNLAAYAYFSPNDLPKPIFFSFAALVIGSLPKEAGGGARGELKGSEYFLEALLGRVLVIRRKGIKVLSCALFSSFSSCCVITGIALLCPQFGQIVASSGVRVLTVLNLLRSIFKMYQIWAMSAGRSPPHGPLRLSALLPSLYLIHWSRRSALPF